MLEIEEEKNEGAGKQKESTCVRVSVGGERKMKGAEKRRLNKISCEIAKKKQTMNLDIDGD